MIGTATREGLVVARRTPRLTVTLWLLNLALALAAGVPGWLTLRSAIGRLPEADRLRHGFDLGVRTSGPVPAGTAWRKTR